MPMLAHRAQSIKQILKNTELIMDHLGIQREQIQEHKRILDDHGLRIDEIERHLAEHGFKSHLHVCVKPAEAKLIADKVDLSVNELYQILANAGVIVPRNGRSTQTHRINGIPTRVVVLKRAGDLI